MLTHTCVFSNSAIFAPIVARNTEDGINFQGIHRKAMKSWFKSKKSVTYQSSFSRTMLGGHSNEDKMTRSIETDLKNFCWGGF